MNLWGIRGGEQGVLKQLRINWNPNKKLLAPCFIKSLCFSARLCSRDLNKKQDQPFSDFAFFDDFLLSRDLQEGTLLQEIDD